MHIFSFPRKRVWFFYRGVSFFVLVQRSRFLLRAAGLTVPRKPREKSPVIDPHPTLSRKARGTIWRGSRGSGAQSHCASPGRLSRPAGLFVWVPPVLQAGVWHPDLQAEVNSQEDPGGAFRPQGASAGNRRERWSRSLLPPRFEQQDLLLSPGKGSGNGGDRGAAGLSWTGARSQTSSPWGWSIQWKRVWG